MEAEGQCRCSCCTKHVQQVADIQESHAYTLRQMQTSIIELTRKHKQTTASIIIAQNDAVKNREEGNAAIEMLRKYASQIGIIGTERNLNFTSIDKRIQELIKENKMLTDTVAQSSELAERNHAEHQEIVGNLKSHVARLQEEKRAFEDRVGQFSELAERNHTEHQDIVGNLKSHVACLQEKHKDLEERNKNLNAHMSLLERENSSLKKENTMLVEQSNKIKETPRSQSFESGVVRTGSPSFFTREKSLKMMRENEKLATLLRDEEKKVKSLEGALTVTQKLIDMMTSDRYQEEGDLLEILDQISGTPFSYERSLEKLIKIQVLNKNRS